MTYEEYLKENEELTYRFKGISMNPLLKEGRDIFTVHRREPGQRFKPYDVVLYHRGDQYVLHRIVKVLPEGHYVILGDNCINYEYDTCDDDILGWMTSFVRKGKSITVENRLYRLYAVLRVNLAPLRIFRIKCINKMKRIIKRILGL